MDNNNHILKNRNYSLDFIRSIAIIFIICVHSMGTLEKAVTSSIIDINRIVHIFLSSFIHMGVPLFTMLSGALLLGKYDKPVFFLNKRFKRIITPFLIWSIIVFTLDKITAQQSFPIIPTITEFFAKFLTKEVHGIYWYIYMLIGLYLLTPILQKIFKDISSSLLHYLLLILTLFIIIQNLMPANYTDNILLFNYSFPYLVYIGYYIGGYYLYAHSIKLINFHRITNVGFFTFYLLGILNSIFSFTTFPLYFFSVTILFWHINFKKTENTSNQ